jgi:hypothetical protein
MVGWVSTQPTSTAFRQRIKEEPMKRMRFSIAGLMGFVLVAALGFGGLKGADETWASGCYTLVVATLILAVLTAVQSRRGNRAYWAGFAIAGWVYFGVVFGAMGPYRVISPQLLTELLFDRLEAMMHPSNTFTYTVSVTSPSIMTSSTTVATGSPAITITGSLSGQASGATISGPNNPAPPVPVPPVAPTIAIATPPAPRFLTMPPLNMPRVHFSQVAHSLMVLVVGMLGGFYSVWLWTRRERRGAEPVAEVKPSSA